MNGEKSYVLLNDHILPILKRFAFNTAPSDQATEATIDLALLLEIPFGVSFAHGAAVYPAWVERTFEICSPCLYGCLTSICHQLL